MTKKIFILIIFMNTFLTNAYPAGSSDSDSSKSKSSYDRAVSLIKLAKRYKKKK